MQSRSLAILALSALGCALSAPAPGLAQEAASYTAEQASGGASAYTEHCAGCHLETMEGSFEAPQLAGPNFLRFWGDRPANELAEMVALMPPDEEGSLGEDVYAAITAYILARNGFPVGDEPLTVSSSGLLSGATVSRR